MSKKQEKLTPEYVNQKLVDAMIDDPGKMSKIIAALMAQGFAAMCFDQTLAMIARMNEAVQVQREIEQQNNLVQLMDLI